MKNWWLFAALVASFSAHVAAADSLPEPGSFYMGFLKEDINQSGVFELGMKGQVNRFVDANAALMWFGNNDNVYNGFNFGAHLTTGTWPIKAYAGAGLFLGEHDECDEQDTDICETDYVAGVYPEVGVELSFFQLNVAAYGRYYKTSDTGKNEYKMFGAYIGYDF
ncbi:hypothetical protein [Vibrio quintilis]|uniref:Outer membrane protein beta-barrel domain-containing protein n=1 Tax=Vibrio quintilis TaxID=1117707 RepID=A0A1M7Z0D7_9VIBR|nr:hypothetical protein [Vibrio quintilis]SHO58275.1 hypothetical protein VQ7734_04046 [Vibrio quintilis]